MIKKKMEHLVAIAVEANKDCDGWWDKVGYMLVATSTPGLFEVLNVEKGETEPGMIVYRSAGDTTHIGLVSPKEAR